MAKSSSIHRTYWLQDVAYDSGRVACGIRVYDAIPTVGLKLLRLGFNPVLERAMLFNSEFNINRWKDYVKKNRL